MAHDHHQQWPPRSPHEARRGTPGGRQRLDRLSEPTSPSPSPRKRREGALMSSASMTALPAADEDDEEMLQLQLQEIQARLRLKKLQAARNKENEPRAHNTSDAASRLSPSSSTQAARYPERARTPEPDDQSATAKLNRIQVAASPVRKVQRPQSQTSPSRVMLGIDKGLKASEVSLKRAPSQKRFNNEAGEPGQFGGYLRRSRTPGVAASADPPERPMSFNERLAAVRDDEVARAERQERIQNVRTNAFGIGQREIEQYKRNAVEIPDQPLQAPQFSREDVLSNTKPASGGLQRSNTMPSLRDAGDDDSSSTAATRPRPSKILPSEMTDEQTESFEPYSSFHLSRRILPHTVLTRHVTGKKIYSLKQLLKVVKSPEYALPDIEQDIVIFAIVGKKSDPKEQKSGPDRNGVGTEKRGKFLVLTLIDLQWEVDLFLFNTGFNRFWKIPEGTVIGILNPRIMPPRVHDSGKFSLVINCDEEVVLEAGIARDLGFCQSVKKDGQLCMAWVNKKRTQFCEWHSNEAVNKQRGKRKEVNEAGFFSGGTQYDPKWKEKRMGNNGIKKQPGTYDFETKTRYFASRSHSAADLIDGRATDLADRKEKAEALKRNNEAKERERDMMKKLGKIGNAAGREYMKYSGSHIPGSASAPLSDAAPGPTRLDATALGLLGRKGNAVHLSPIKRKRAESSQAGSLAGSTSGSLASSGAFGWGSNLKDKLSKMKEGENLHQSAEGRERSPQRKKTRFVTEKGIRVAGRESLGNELADRQVNLEDDDEDELVIMG